MKRFGMALAVWLGAVQVCVAYPLEGYEKTGIARLEAYRLAQTGKVRGRLLPPGARLPDDTVRLRLADRPDFQIPAPDPALTEAIQTLLTADASGYALAVLDLTDPDRPRYAEHNGDHPQNPGSVGKLMVLLAWFQALADVYPDDVDARFRLMRDTVHTADGFIRTDSHTVPFWHPGDAKVEQRPIRIGDEGNLYTWLDWMTSSSSNAAASTIMSQIVLLRHFGSEYPVAPDTASRFFRDTPTSKLTRIYLDAMRLPITRHGLDLERLRQGSFFTKEGKRRVPGTNSVATPNELLRLLVLLEQGKLVDPWSSLEIKRLLYLTEKRIRYASSRSLRRAALFFKSGSWYGCKPEPGFECGKYRGNVRNFLNSTTIVETDELGGRKLRYIVVLLSNVLRKNSALIHRDLATGIHAVMEFDHPIGAAPATPPELATPRTPSPDAAPEGPAEEFDYSDEPGEPPGVERDDEATPTTEEVSESEGDDSAGDAATGAEP